MRQITMTHLVSFPMAVLVLLVLLLTNCVDGFGVPGTSTTLNGYDTEGGVDPVCWTAQSDLAALAQAEADAQSSAQSGRRANTGESTPVLSTPWDNKLYKSFILTGEVGLLPTCPAGVELEGDAPVELRERGEVMRTGRFYDYVVRGSINLDNMRGEQIFSDAGPRIAVQIILCEVGQGLCSPFVHEHANDRLVAANATKTMAVGDRHGDTHVHAPTVFLTLPDPSAGGIQRFEVAVPTKVNDPGFFFAIAAYQVFTEDGEGSETPMQYKYDVANALSTRLITYHDPPEILTVTKGVQIAVAILIALSVAALSYILLQTVRLRKKRVMQLSQAPFLVAFVSAAIIATLCTFLFNPKNDIYCQIRGPCVLIPLQIMYAIIIGRLWRINNVISPLLTMAIEKDKNKCSSYVSRKCFDCLTAISNIGSSISCSKDRKAPASKRGSMRSTVSDVQLCKVIFAFTVPQIVMQILSLTLQPSELIVDFNMEESVGQTMCTTQDRAATSLEMWCWYLLLLFFVLTLFLAYESRTLPSLFNETESIYNSILISILVMAVGLATIRLSESPTTSPDVAYLLRVLIVLTMTLNAALRTMLPKLRLAWSGKPVLINKLVTDHRLASQSSFNNSSTSATPNYNSMNSMNSANSARFDSSQASDKGELSRSEVSAEDKKSDPTTDVAIRAEPRIDSELSTNSTEFGANEGTHANGSARVRFVDEEAPPAPPAAKHCEASGRASQRRLAIKSTEVRISDTRAPNRSFILKMMEAQKALGDVNHDINSGYAVSHEEWDTLREACVELGAVFRNDVKFDWETADVKEGG